ncbi:hypothetical protein NDU88_002420 [Pleurodeles waltl]|uniref:Uncharacterized protein n=1 Tax=Pleurodeles waltl TaxID=8319 RepID=A0AAV7T1V8_PLEWA|nr:hypothetical protein NDU88_002420 [Pleurodeles waltl]
MVVVVRPPMWRSGNHIMTVAVAPLSGHQHCWIITFSLSGGAGGPNPPGLQGIGAGGGDPVVEVVCVIDEAVGEFWVV